jgi:hypothetical protein
LESLDFCASFRLHVVLLSEDSQHVSLQITIPIVVGRLFNQALFKSLSHMVEDPPLPPNADPTAENVHKWQAWWAKNESTAKFAYATPYE